METIGIIVVFIYQLPEDCDILGKTSGRSLA